MSRISTFCAGAMLLTVLFACGSFAATARVELTREQVKDLAERVERATNDFKKTIADKLGSAKGGEAKSMNSINKQVSKLETATDKLKREVSGDSKGVIKTIAIRADVKRVVEEAEEVDKIIRAGKWDARIKLDWVKIRTAVNVLAENYELDKVNEKE